MENIGLVIISFMIIGCILMKIFPNFTNRIFSKLFDFIYDFITKYFMFFWNKLKKINKMYLKKQSYYKADLVEGIIYLIGIIIKWKE